MGVQVGGLSTTLFYIQRARSTSGSIIGHTSSVTVVREATFGRLKMYNDLVDHMRSSKLTSSTRAI
jgi:hypothetical protein